MKFDYNINWWYVQVEYEQNQNLNENKIIWFVKLALTLQIYSNIGV